MFVSSLLTASSLLLATALAEDTPYSQFLDDANYLLAAPTGNEAAQLSALYAWQATQTAVPSSDLQSQHQDYLDAYFTTTSAPLPSWVTAVPSSLQPVATSFLQAEASLVVQDIAPLLSQATAAVATSPLGQTADTAAVSTPTQTATTSSGFTTAFANATASQVSGNATAPTPSPNSTVLVNAPASPTKSATRPVSVSPSSGAEKPAGVAMAAAVVGILGTVVLL